AGIGGELLLHTPEVAESARGEPVAFRPTLDEDFDELGDARHRGHDQGARGRKCGWPLGIRAVSEQELEAREALLRRTVPLAVRPLLDQCVKRPVAAPARIPVGAVALEQLEGREVRTRRCGEGELRLSREVRVAL